MLMSHSQYAKAEILYRYALRERTEVLSNKHPNTVTTVNNLADLLQAQSQ